MSRVAAMGAIAARGDVSEKNLIGVQRYPPFLVWYSRLRAVLSLPPLPGSARLRASVSGYGPRVCPTDNR